jgi:mRNA interferase MazF
MKRGEIWTASGGPGYAGKPRPVVIIQADSFAATGSVTICAFTTDPTDAPLFRLTVEPNSSQRPALRLPNHGRQNHDRFAREARRKNRPPSRIGRLDDGDLRRFNRSALLFLGLAESARR